MLQDIQRSIDAKAKQLRAPAKQGASRARSRAAAPRTVNTPARQTASKAAPGGGPKTFLQQAWAIAQRLMTSQFAPMLAMFLVVMMARSWLPGKCASHSASSSQPRRLTSKLCAGETQMLHAILSRGPCMSLVISYNEHLQRVLNAHTRLALQSSTV